MIPPIVNAMVEAMQDSLIELRGRISEVEDYGFTDDMRYCRIKFKFDDKQYVAVLRGRNAEFVIGSSEEFDKAIALRTILDNDAVEID